MTFPKLLATTALVGALVAFPAAAQQSGGGQTGGQAGQAQGGLPGQRLAQEQAQGEGAQIYVSPAGTREIQQALNNAGYDVGNVDGTWNETTRTAAQNFQQAQGLEPTGTLTVRTIVALGQENLLRGQLGGEGAQGGLPGQRLAQETAQEQGTPLYAGPAAVRSIQQALNDAGYDVGNVDGEWNDETSQAAMNFSQAQGLEPTGVLDIGLIQALGVTQQVFQPSGASGGGQQTGDGSGGLPGQRLAQEEAASEGTPLYLSPAQVREITLALNEAGYDAGNVDAGWGDATSEAARNYQQAQGLEPTGSLTTSLMAQLGMSDWMSGGASATGSVGGGQGSGGQGTGGSNQQIIQEGTGGQGLGGGSTPAPIQPQ